GGCAKHDVLRGAGRRWHAGCFGTVRGGRRVAAGSQHAPWAREMDVWWRARHLRREPESRLSARWGRAPEDRPATDTAISRGWPERAVSTCGSAVAQREHGLAARSGRGGGGPRERGGTMW